MKNNDIFLDTRVNDISITKETSPLEDYEAPTIQFYSFNLMDIMDLSGENTNGQDDGTWD